MATNKPNQPQKGPEVVAMEKIENQAFIRDQAWISHLLDQVQAQRFHGDIRLIFQKGLCVRAEKIQSLKPPHLDTQG